MCLMLNEGLRLELRHDYLYAVSRNKQIKKDFGGGDRVVVGNSQRKWIGFMK
jgi:hypothetical protein